MLHFLYVQHKPERVMHFKACFDAIALGEHKTCDLGGPGTCSSFTADICARIANMD